MSDGASPLQAVVRPALLIGVALAVLLALSTQHAAAAGTPNAWTDANHNNLWSDAGNWSLSHAPTATEIAVFDTTSPDNAIVDVPFSVSGVQMAAGYGGTVTVASPLNVGADGLTQAGGVIGGPSLLTASSLSLTGGTFSVGTLHVNGTTLIGIASVTTFGTQAYDGGVTLATSVNLTASSVTFGQTVDSAGPGLQDLTVTGDAVFDGAVGAGIALQRLHVTGTTVLNGGSVTTSGSQAYDGIVGLGVSSNLTASTVTFGHAVDGVSAGLQDLTVTGNASFNGGVGAGIPLHRLHVTGNTRLNAGSVRTTGAQAYDGALTVAATSNLIATTASFGGTVDDGFATIHALTVTGNASFNAAVGGAAALRSLHVAGTTVLNAGSVTVAGTQAYDGAVTLGATSNLTATTTTFGGTLDDAAANTHDLTVTGDAVFNGAVGGVPLHSAHVTGSTTLN
jgi:mucin-19